MMKKWSLWLGLSALIFVTLIGCRSAPMINLDDPQYTKIAIAPFAIAQGAEDMARLVTDLGTSISLAVEDKEWVYDQSEQLAPVSKVLEANNLTPDEIFVEPALAAKVGAELGVDLIFVGKIHKPRIQTKEDNTIYYDKSNQYAKGDKSSTRFTLVFQSATEDIELKLVDPKAGAAIWHGNVKGYIKYIRDFMAQDPAKEYARVPEDQIRADLRKHLIRQLQATMFPARFTKIPLPEVLLKPKHELMSSGGKPIFF